MFYFSVGPFSSQRVLVIMISFILTFLWEVVVALVSPSPYIKETNAENGSWTDLRLHGKPTGPEPKT